MLCVHFHLYQGSCFLTLLILFSLSLAQGLCINLHNCEFSKFLPIINLYVSFERKDSHDLVHALTMSLSASASEMHILPIFVLCEVNLVLSRVQQVRISCLT